MKKAALSLGAAAALAAGTGWTPVASAQTKAEEAPYALTGNINLVSQYRYRGIAQTNNKPAVQGGFDFTHGTGFYVGTWASNVNWLSDQSAAIGRGISNSLEWDFYGGYKGTLGDFGYDVGFLYYYYPGTYPTGFVSPNTREVYLAGTWKMLTLKYSHSIGNLFGFADSEGAGYLDLTGNFEVGGGFTVVAHAGHQRVPGSSDVGRARRDCSYSDWRLGVTKEVIGVTVGLAYVDTNAKGDAGQCYRNVFNRDLGKATVVLSVGKTF